MSENERFRVTDRRAGARSAVASTGSPGLVLGQSVASAKAAAQLGSSASRDALGAGRQGPIPTDPSESRRMQVQRTAGSRLGSMGIGGGSGMSVNFASQRPQDPFFYWQQNNLPYDFSDPRHMMLLRELCRHIYKAHSVMASAIDIYSYWPLMDMEFECKDRALTDFYTDLFFDQLDYCNTSDAPIWMGDYSFRPLGEVQVGDEVIGWESRPTRGGRDHTKLTRTKVTGRKVRMAPEVVKVTFASGRTIKCTPDHLWANPDYRPSKPLAEKTLKARVRYAKAVEMFDRGARQVAVANMLGVTGQVAWEYHQRWKAGEKPKGEAREFSRFNQPMAPAKVGAYLRHVIDPSPVLTSEKEREVAAWLGGVYDGEGTGASIAQCPNHNPDVYQRIVDSLDFLGFRHKDHHKGVSLKIHDGKAKGVGSKRAARQQIVDFLNQCNPTRRQTTAIDKLMLTFNFGERDKVVSIESLGAGEVVSLQTESGNYVAWGFASKNCEFLPSLLHEYWVVGEAFPLGSFNETLGVWEADELLNPNDVFVETSPFVKDPNLYIRLPESLRKVLTTGQPPEQYHALMRSYPELRAYATENARMPVSNVLLKHLKFKGDNFASRGLPIMYRALRPLMQEEMMNAAQDAIADRLYTPLVLATLGASAQDLGTEEPWIPTQDQIANFEMGLDAALAADFRVLTTHFATDMKTVFGRETMPNFDADFERLTEKQLQAFGMSKTMLSGAGGGETYAADAMNRDLVSQLLGRAQRYVRKFVRDRMLVVAEAQEHYDYEVRGGKRYPIMEEILEVDEETGEQRIVEQPKLLVPELKLKGMNLKDEQTERDFLEAMRDRGVPISQKRRFVNVDVDLDAEVEAVAKEQVEQAVEAQRVRKQTYLRLKAEGLPIPQDLRDDFEPRAQGGGPTESASAPSRVPTVGVDGQDVSALSPTLDELATPPGEPLGTPAGPGGTIVGPDGSGGNVIPLPRNRLFDRSRPEESDEMRADMPKSSALDHLPPPPTLKRGVDQSEIWEGDAPVVAKAGGIIQGPRHVGLRRWAGVSSDTPIGDD